MPAAFKTEEFSVADQAQNIQLSQLCGLTRSEHSKAFRRGRAQQNCAERTTNQNKWELTTGTSPTFTQQKDIVQITHPK